MYQLFALYNDNWVNILPKSNNLSWSNDKDTLAMELSFDSLYDLSNGSKLALRIDDTYNLFSGIIIKQSKKQFVNSYTAVDFAWYLNKNKITMQFNNIAASTAINQLLGAVGLIGDIDYMPTIINKIFKTSALNEIIDDILSQVKDETGNKYIKEMRDTTLRVKKLSDLVITPKLIIGKDVSYSSSIDGMKNSVVVISDEESNYRVLESAKDTDSINNYGLLQEILTVNDKDESQARNTALNYLNENNKAVIDFSFNAVAVSGGNDIRANRMLYINFPSLGINQYCRIKSVNHTIANNQHKVSLTMEV